MPAGSKRGLVAPQNTFLDNIIRKTNQLEAHSCFLIANAQLYEWPIVFANESFCSDTGFSRAEVVTKPCHCPFMHGASSTTDPLKRMEEVLQHKETFVYENLLYLKNGTPSWFHIQVAPVKNDVGVTVLFLVIFKDVSHTKNLQPCLPSKLSSNKLTSFVRNMQQAKELAMEEKLAHSGEETARSDKHLEVAKVNPDILPKYHHEAPKTPRAIVLHYSTFKTVWDWFILILTFYTAIIVPYNVAFQVKDRRAEWLASDSVVDIIFLCDICINFHTTYVGPTGEIISDPKIIKMNYLKSWFVIDLLSCLPYDMVNFFFSQTDGFTDEGISSLFSSLKVARLLRLGRVARKLDHYIEYGGAMLVLLVCFFGLSGHWLACIWYSIGFGNLSDNGTIVQHNWLAMLGETTRKPYFVYLNGTIGGGPSLPESYIAALYFTMTSLTSVGFGNVAGNTQNEQIFCVIMLIFGALLYATIFGNVTTIIQQMYADTNRYHDMLNSVREFLKLYEIPSGLGDRIMDYIVSTWSISKGIDRQKVLNYCPKDMKADICVHLNRKVFNRHAAFRLASDSCLRALAIEFMTTHNAPGDMIYHKGESVDSLNFIVSGSLEVIQEDEVVAILYKGDVFGDAFYEDSLMIRQSESHVRALTYCDLHSIKRDALLRVLKFYDDFALSFKKKMTLTINLRKRFFFRKLADVNAEKEALKIHKDEPKSEDFPDDHIIRQMFRRYRDKFRERRLKNQTQQADNEQPLQKRDPGNGSRQKGDAKGDRADKAQRNNPNDHRSTAAQDAGDNKRNQAAVDSDRLVATLNRSIRDLNSGMQGLGDRMTSMEHALQKITSLLSKKRVSFANENNSCNLQIDTRPRAVTKKPETLSKGKKQRVKRFQGQAGGDRSRSKLPDTTLIYENESTQRNDTLNDKPSCSKAADDVIIYDLETDDL